MVHEELALARSRARALDDEQVIEKVEISEPAFARKVFFIVFISIFTVY